MDVLLLISCRKANKYLYAVNQDIVIFAMYNHVELWLLL